YAVDETNRRRRIQAAYNREHDITPKTIERDVTDIVQLMRRSRDIHYPEIRNVDRLSRKEITTTISDLRNQMTEAASRLEFERAAKLRDQIKELRKGR
ncbi:UvrB/UvrC motif-containing protein, partial [Candidatus Bipolaricaulota bacterium]|nr:UvrB/UvrC motif-containing protein [Candidatus Bipolaricaulota bacterium]